MRPFYLLPLLWALPACDAAITAANAEDSLTAAAVAGQEEEITHSGLAPERGEPLPLLRACDALGERARLFDEADGDGSGDLGPEEQDQTLTRHGPPPHHFHFMRWVYDADDSGDLDEAERATLLDDHTARCEAMQARLLAEWDADGDGALSDDELEAARAAHEAERDGDRAPGRPGGQGGPPPSEQRGAVPPPVQDEFDADGDGEISSGEASVAREVLRERIRSGERPMTRPE